MKKRILALLLASVMVFALAACSGSSGSKTTATPAATAAPTATPAAEGVTLDNIKVGFVHISDPSDKGYTYNHDLGTQKMKAALGLRDDQVISKYNVPESAECDTAIRELVEDILCIQCRFMSWRSLNHFS
jgi:basic membrane protein A